MCLQTYIINSDTSHTYDDQEDYEENAETWDDRPDYNTLIISEFKPTYNRASDGTFSKITDISKQIEQMNLMYEIGNILFKDGRSKSTEDKAALKLYYKDKYKRLKIE